jgi:ATP-binding cassette subfamily C protein
MWRNLKTCFGFVEPGRRWRWAALAALAVFAASLDSIGAAAVYGLVRLLDTPERLAADPAIARVLEATGLDPLGLVIAAASALAAFFVVKNVVLLGVAHLQHREIYGGASRLAARLFRGYLMAPFVFNLRRNSAETMRNIAAAVDVVYRQVIGGAVMVVSEALVVIAILAVLFVVQPAVMLGATLLFAIFGALLLAFSLPRNQRLGRAATELMRRDLQALQQGLGGIKEIKVLGREAHFVADYARIREALSYAQCTFDTIQQTPRLGLETVFVLTMTILTAGVVLRDGAGPAVVQLLGLFAYAGLRLIPSAHRMIGALNQLRWGGAAIDDIARDIRATESFAVSAAPAPVAALAFREAIRFEHVAYRYPGAPRAVLDGIDLTIRRGASIGIVGPTGAGKSTLIDILLGLLAPSAGRLAVDGVDIAGEAVSAAWRAKIGFVPQAFYLLDADLRRNIAFGLEEREIDDARVAAAVEGAQLKDFVASLPRGLATEVGERGVRLSGGQRQRLAIARALYLAPEVLVFDEATSALDYQTEAELVRAIEALGGARTIVIIAHRLSTVRKCDSIVFLKDGRVADQGRYDELFARNADFRALAQAGEGA